jgi:hypothetical protein
MISSSNSWNLGIGLGGTHSSGGWNGPSPYVLACKPLDSRQTDQLRERISTKNMGAFPTPTEPRAAGCAELRNFPSIKGKK